MKEFKGTINGTSYDSKEEFIEALKALNEDENVTVKYTETDTTENELKKEFDEYKRLVANVLAGFNTLFATDGLKILRGGEKAIKDAEKTKNDKKEISAPTLKELEDTYIFEESPYEFKGDEEDEIELNKFDKLMNEYGDRFEEIVNDLSEETRQRFYKTVIEKYKNARANMNTLASALHGIDEKIAKYENIIQISASIDYAIHESAQKEYDELTRRFDIVENRKNYHELLANYYFRLLNAADQRCNP